MISMYRVKEVKGWFIPQVWIFGWVDIDRGSDYSWSGDDDQLKYCKYTTLERARERIQEYRKKDKIKYHKA